MSYGSNRFLEDRRFVKRLFEWKMRNVMDGSVLHSAVITEEALEVLSPASKGGRIVSEEDLFIRTVQGSMNVMSGSMHCL